MLDVVYGAPAGTEEMLSKKMKISMDKGGGSGRGNGNSGGAGFGGRRITGSDRDFSLELDVGYRSVSVSPKGLYDGREFILDRGESSRGGEGGRGRSGIVPVADYGKR